ncbi:MAG: cytochrome c peroxidase [Pseudomonadota bacterium]|nr:cytochrome c peroxidase [Pseudomonadota bacterium]
MHLKGKFGNFRKSGGAEPPGWLWRALAALAWVPLLLAVSTDAAPALDARYFEKPATGQPAAPRPVPPQLAGLDTMPSDNPVTAAGIALGRVLFYDRGLSANGLVSCSSCHAQASGFDDPTRFSIGFRGRITRRSAMALANARFNPRRRYFHDERAPGLEAQVLQPFTDAVEMGLVPGELLERIASRPWYAGLFEAAFGDPAITEIRVARALAQFVRSIVAMESRYDLARAANPDRLAAFPQFTDIENRGKFLFIASRDRGGAGCAACHATDAFVLIEPRDNGLPADPDRPDTGIAETTGRDADRGRFRTASLKNIAASAPYMHDGRFATLDAVVDHYARGIAPNENLAAELRDADGSPARLELSEADRDALVAFLRTLTDETMLNDPRLADPFRQAR